MALRWVQFLVLWQETTGWILDRVIFNRAAPSVCSEMSRATLFLTACALARDNRAGPRQQPLRMGGAGRLLGNESLDSVLIKCVEAPLGSSSAARHPFSWPLPVNRHSALCGPGITAPAVGALRK